MKKARSKPSKTVGGRIIEGLTELRDALRSGTPLERRFTVRTVSIPEPETFDARRVQALRSKLQMSQHVFAQVLGVSTILVQSWEQGVRQPSPLARRLLTEIERNPEHWQRMVVSPPHSIQNRRMSA